MWQTKGKAVIAALFFLWTVVEPLLTGDGRIHGYLEWCIILTGFLNMLLVYIVPLNRSWEGGKTVINGGLASLAAAQTVLADGFQYNDLTIIIGAGLALLIGWYAPTISMRGTAEQARVPAGFNA